MSPQTLAKLVAKALTKHAGSDKLVEPPIQLVAWVPAFELDGLVMWYLRECPKLIEVQHEVSVRIMVCGAWVSFLPSPDNVCRVGAWTEHWDDAKILAKLKLEKEE